MPCHFWERTISWLMAKLATHAVNPSNKNWYSGIVDFRGHSWTRTDSVRVDEWQLIGGNSGQVRGPNDLAIIH
jgi:hypothetical protein